MKNRALGLLKKLINKKTFLAVIIFAIIYVVLTRNAKDVGKIETQQIQKEDVVTTVSSSGVIEAIDQVDVRFQTSGKIAYVGVKQGDFVKKFQTIATLDTKELQKRLERDLNLYTSERVEFDETRETIKDKELTTSLRKIAEQAQNSLDNTVIDVELRDLAIKYSAIYSPIEGYVVNDIVVYPGTNVLPTETIATVANTQNLIFKAEVDETEIANVQENQTAQLILDSYPEESTPTTVTKILPVATTTSTGSTAYEVFLALPQNTKFKIGMNGTADIELQKSQNVLTLPIEALQEETFVWVKTGNKYEKKEVEKGIESDSKVEIKSGLQEGDVVVTSGFEEIQKGSILQKITGQ